MTGSEDTRGFEFDHDSQAAWRPVMALTYGIAATGAIQFLGAGFHSIERIQNGLGGLAGPAMSHDAGLLMVLAIASALAWPLASRQLEQARSASDVVRNLTWCLAAAAVLAFPPVQWLTFGRPAATPAPAQVAPGPAAKSLPIGGSNG